jgi:hypothetical protein
MSFFFSFPPIKSPTNSNPRECLIVATANCPIRNLLRNRRHLHKSKTETGQALSSETNVYCSVAYLRSPVLLNLSHFATIFRNKLSQRKDPEPDDNRTIAIFIPSPVHQSRFSSAPSFSGGSRIPTN